MNDSQSLVSDRPTTNPERRRWDRVIAQLRSGRLDTEIATGRSARDRYQAIRAEQLVARGTREDLASHWLLVLERAGRARPAADPRERFQRRRILAAEPAIAELIGRLRGSEPVCARGVALAKRLITDGGGPVHSPSSELDLDDAVREATARLNLLQQRVTA